MKLPMTTVQALDPYYDLCPFCLDELRRGVPANGMCDHEALLDAYPHLRFNATDHHDRETLIESAKQYAEVYRGKT